MRFLKTNPNLIIVALLAIVYSLLPVAFIYIDSFTYIYTKCHFQIPHYPPLYPSLLFAIQTLVGINFWYVWLAMTINFLLLAIAYLYWQTILPSWVNKYLAFFIFLLFNFPMLLNTKGFSSESLFLPAIFILFTASVHIAATTKMRYKHFIIFFLSLSLLCLTRYTGIVLGGFLPLYLALLAIRKHPQSFRKILLSVAIVIMCLCINKAAIYTCAKVMKTSTVGTYGRAGLYRIFLTFDEVKSPQQKAMMVQTWRNHTNDPEILLTINEIATAQPNDLWLPLLINLKVKLRPSYPYYTRDELDDKANQLLNKAFIYFLLDANKYYFKSILQNDVPLFFVNNDYSDYLAINNLTANNFWKFTFSNCDETLWAKYLKHYPPATFIIASFINSIINFLTILLLCKLIWEKLRGRLSFDEWMLFMAVIIMYFGYQLTTAALTIFLARYGLPAHCLLGFWITLTICRHPEWIFLKVK